MTRASHSRRHPRGLRHLRLPLACFLLPLLICLPPAHAQTPRELSASDPIQLQTTARLSPSPASGIASNNLDRTSARPSPQSSATRRAHRFAAPRLLTSASTTARLAASARVQSARLAASPTPQPRASLSALSAAWLPAGPAAIQSLHDGAISGRITSLAVDPADPSGNTLFVGTTGGGVWRSTNALAAPAGVAFTPLTDSLPVFNANAGAAAVPSLSIGALTSLPGGILLAGTGDPNDSSDSFYGSGILRSTDSGLTWSLAANSVEASGVQHSFFGLGIAGFAYSSANPALVVAAVSQSAEGTLVNAPDATYSVMGLYYSADAGVSWHMSTLLDGNATLQDPAAGILPGPAATAVVWNPVRQRFLAAVRYHGLYQSADGITWTRLANQPGSTLSLSACPTVTLTSGAASCPLFRAALAVQPISGDTFVLFTDSNNQDGGLYQDVCALSGTTCTTPAPAFAQRLASAALETATSAALPKTIPQADYNLTLAAVPAANASAPDTLLFVGTADLFRCSLAAGCSLRNTTNTANGCVSPALVAPAQHALALGPAGAGSTPTLFLGNDGGLWRSSDLVNQLATPCSSDDAAHFQNLNANLGSLAEVVSFAQNPSDPAVLLAGLGGSGTVATARADQTAWQQLSSGEGGAVAIDPTNPALWYLSTASGLSVSTCTSGAECTPAELTPVLGPAQVAEDLALQDAPWLLDPAAPASLLAGTCRVWRGPATAPTLWSGSNVLSPAFSGPGNSTCNATNGFIRSLAAGGAPTARTSPVLYAGMAGRQSGGGATKGGHLFATSSANLASVATAWTDLAASPVTNDLANAGRFNPAGFEISSVTADPHDSTGRTVYATVQGFTNNGISARALYGSTDGGAHWTNLSANLPDAPANAVLVDPNDANTVYLALDTGVYVTTEITTCLTTNCWSLFGASLPNAPVTTLAASAALPTGDGRIGLLRAGTYGRGLWQIPLLSASTIQQPAILLSLSTLAFTTSQAVGTASVPETVSVTNTGTAPLLVSKLAITSGNEPTGVTTIVTDFTSTSTCLGTPLAPGGTCSLAITFAPSASGARSSTLTLYANVPGGQATLALSGNATAPAAVQLSPGSLSFPDTTLAATSLAQNLTLNNTGGTVVAISSVTLTGSDFRIAANTCGATLAPSTACTLAVVFAPAATGSRAGTLTIVDDLGTQVAALAGTADTPATDALSSASLAFPATEITGTPPTQQLVLTNAGDLALTLIAASVSSSEFSVSNGCANSLAPHSACALTVAFVPHSVGPVTATLTLADEFRTQTVVLAGTGIAPPGVSLLPSGTVSFAAVGLGQTSAATILTLTNNGGLPLVLQSISFTGDYALAAQGTSCAASLAPASACSLAVVFSPALAGPRPGSITIVSNAPNSPQTVALTGNAIDFTLAIDGPASLTIPTGGNAAFPLLLAAPASSNGIPVTLACTGVPANATCTLSPATLTLGASTLVTATINTGVAPTTTASSATAASRSPSQLSVTDPQSLRFNRRGSLGDGDGSLLLAGLLPIGLLALRYHRRLPALLALCLLALLPLALSTGLAGCSATGREVPGAAGPGGSSQPASTTPTPSGTYTVTVTATSGGLSRSVDLTLTVQ